LKLPTNYNPVTKTLTANVKGVGEFILARPDLESLVLTPLPNAPKDSSTINDQLPVAISWSPVGYVESYHFQLASDDGFNNLLVDANGLTNAFYLLNTLQKDAHYYWRVKATNDAGESEWSATHTFSAIAPFVTVTIPNGGEQWQRGLSYFIQWKDNLAEDVTIQLYKGDKLSATLANTSNLGAYKWAINSNLATGTDYSIKIKSKVDNTLFDVSDSTFSIIDTTGSAVLNETAVVKEFALDQNYPNPFNPTTIINYSIPKQSHVTIKVYDVTGREAATLVNEEKPMGNYKVEFNADHFSGGIYLYQIKTEGLTLTKKMLLLK
jgi:hypothetical protein